MIYVLSAKGRPYIAFTTREAAEAHIANTRHLRNGARDPVIHAIRLV